MIPVAIRRGWAYPWKSVVVMTLFLHLMNLQPSPARADGAAPPMPYTTALTSVGPGVPKPASPAVAQVTGPDGPTPAGLAFCQRMPSECSVDLSEPSEIQLTTKVLALLRTITEQVNAAIKPMTDMVHWGAEDRWSYPHDGYGDCEDFQLLKRKRLIESGLPRRVLRMAVVLDQNGGGHAVLMVRTTAGDLVLDNKTSVVLPWRETGYRFVKREGQDGPAWVSLLAPPSQVAGVLSVGSGRQKRPLRRR